VMDSGHLRNLVAASTIGSKHRLDLMRESKPYQAELVVQEAPRERAKKSQSASASAATAHPLSGVIFDDVTTPLARQMDLSVTSGVVVTDIEEGSLAESSGLQPGDVVMELNRQPIHNFDGFQRLADVIKPSSLALLLINRQGNVMYIPVQGE
jgi:serine protease Do